jgi:HEAT repeat protein
LIRNGGPRGGVVAEGKSPLLRGLHDAKTPRARTAFLDEPDNAGLPEQVREVTAFAKDSDPDLRRSVADALRFTPTPEVQRSLIDRSKDLYARTRPSVAGAVHAALNPAMLVELEQVLKSDGDDAEAGLALMTLLNEKRGEGPELERMLAATADDTHMTSQVRAAARQIRGREIP